MIKLTVSALSAAVLLSTVALAEGAKPVTLTHTYDMTLVSSEAGAAELLADLTSAAKRACTSRVPVMGNYTDKACAESLVVAAVKQIQSASAEAGTDLAPTLQRVAQVQLASTN
jgi:UrcA family protein